MPGLLPPKAPLYCHHPVCIAELPISLQFACLSCQAVPCCQMCTATPVGQPHGQPSHGTGGALWPQQQRHCGSAGQRRHRSVSAQLLSHYTACLHGACPTLLPVPRQDPEPCSHHALCGQVLAAQAVELSQVLCHTHCNNTSDLHRLPRHRCSRELVGRTWLICRDRACLTQMADLQGHQPNNTFASSHVCPSRLGITKIFVSDASAVCCGEGSTVDLTP